jgi:hypothetical protein
MANCFHFNQFCISPVEKSSLACGLLPDSLLKRLASRGGRNRSSTRLPVLGRQLRKGGLAPAPFFIFRPTPGNCLSACHRKVLDGLDRPQRLLRRSPDRISSALRETEPRRSGRKGSDYPGNSVSGCKKMSGRWGDRPLGRGIEGTVIRSQFGFSGRSAALASSRTTHRRRHSRKPKQLPTTRAVCSAENSRSIARWIHSLQYFRATHVPRSLLQMPFGACVEIELVAEVQ